MIEDVNPDCFPENKMFYIDYDYDVRKCKIVCKFSNHLDQLIDAFSDVNPASFFVKQYGYNVSSKISVINSFGFFNIGLYHDIVNFIKTEYGERLINLSKNCLIELKSQLLPFVDYTMTHPIDSYEVLNISDKLELRPYQNDMIKSVIYVGNGRGLIQSPTASGKSFLMANLIYNIDKNNIYKTNHVMIFVPSRQLVDQFYKDLLSYGYNAEDLCMFTSGVKNKGFKKIIISNRSYLFHHLDELPKIDVLICDEVHTVTPDSSTAEFIENLNCHVKIGCTGTLPASKYKKMFLIGIFGKVVHVEDIINLQNQGYLSQLKIISVCGVVKSVDADKSLLFSLKTDRKYAENSTDITFNQSWIDEQDYVIKNSIKLYAPIIEHIQKLPGNVLILFDRLSFGKDISAMATTGSITKDVWYIAGETKIPDREKIREKLESSDNNILFAQSTTFSTGININNLPNIAFFFSGKGDIKVIQSIGRTLRLHAKKKTAVLIDVSFNFKYSQRHCHDRFAIYKKDYLKGSPDETIKVYID